MKVYAINEDNEVEWTVKAKYMHIDGSEGQVAHFSDNDLVAKAKKSLDNITAVKIEGISKMDDKRNSGGSRDEG